jgi:hypothetical protein
MSRKNKVLGYRPGEFEGIREKEFIEKPADIGTRPVPSFYQQGKQEFRERIKKILSENNQSNICANCSKLNSNIICRDIHKDFCELFEKEGEQQD